MRLSRLAPASAAACVALAAALLASCATAPVAPRSSSSAPPQPSPSAVTPPSTTRPSASASPTVAAVQPPTIRAYEFPGGMIEGASGGGKLYTRVNGLLALPSGTGRHPVVVIFHGSYPSCIDLPNDKLFTKEVQITPWPEGCSPARKSQEDGLTSGPDYIRTPSSLAYLAREIASRGFAVVIPDVNTKERLDWGGEPNATMLQTNLGNLHLGILKRLDAGESLGLSWADQVKGRLDTSSIAVVGHSSGGGYALGAAYLGLLPGIKAAVAIEPSIQSTLVSKGSVAPALALIGECDEQIPTGETEGELAEIAQKNPRTPLISAVLAHATHIGTLTGGGSHKIGLVTPNGSAACKDAALLDRSLQRAAIAQLTADFIEQAHAGSTSFTLGSVAGTKTTAKALTAATVTVSPTEKKPGAVDPTSVVYTGSSLTLLPAKPATLRLNGESHV